MAVGIDPAAAEEEDLVGVDVSAGPREEMVVTATRYPKQLDSIPANVSVITADEIENSVARNIPDLLRTQAGLHVTDITGNRASYTVDIRGFGETAALNTLVLVDGRRINSADLSGTDWTTMPLDRVERIEIIRGARSSVIYGDNASGGVINILTRQGQAFQAGVEVAMGSYETLDTVGYIRGSEGKFNYAFSGSRQRSQGYRENSATQFDSLGADFRYYPTPGVQFNLSGGYTNNHAGLPGPLTASEIGAGLPRTESTQSGNFAETHDYYVKAGAEVQISSAVRFTAEASVRRRDSDSIYGGFGAYETDLDTISVSPQIVIEEEVLGLENHLTIGFDYEENDIGIPDQAAPQVARISKEDYGYFIYEEIAPWEGVFLSAGYRYDRAFFSVDSSDYNEEIILDENLYTVGLTYRVNSNFDGYSSFSRGFRYPVLDELYSVWSAPKLLRPQSSNDYELGIRYRRGGRSGLNVNFFYIETRDEILCEPPIGPGLCANANLLDGETRRAGIETSLYAGVKDVDFRIGYVYTDAEIVSGPSYVGNAFPGVPTHQLTLSAVLALGGGFSLAADGRYVGSRPFIGDFENLHPDQEGYFSLNAKLKYAWKKFSVFVDLNNLTDSEYSEFGVLSSMGEESFYPSPEFNMLAGIALDF